MSTAQPIEDGNLPAARQRLGNAISALIDDKPHTIQHDTQGTRVEWVQSLYTQLADAVHTGPGQDGAYLGVPASKPPLWTEAADILRDIDKTIRKWQPDPGIFDGDLTNENPPTPKQSADSAPSTPNGGDPKTPTNSNSGRTDSKSGPTKSETNSSTPNPGKPSTTPAQPAT